MSRTVRVAFVFPGQGSQQVGMGSAFLQQPSLVAVAQQVAQAAADHGAADLLSIMQHGPVERLKETRYTQPAIVAVSLMAWRALQDAGLPAGVEPVVCAGHSLGEFAALVAAGALSVADAAQLIARRGALMQDAPPGAMRVVLGLSADRIREALQPVLASLPADAVLAVANDNGPEQVVLSGTPDALDRAQSVLKEAGAKRILDIPVSGAFHSPLMAQAAAEFAQALHQVQWQPAQLPVVQNTTAQGAQEAAVLLQASQAQMVSGVRWTETMTTLVQHYAVDAVVELGAGQVLAGLFKKSGGLRSVPVLGVSDPESLAGTLQQLADMVTVDQSPPRQDAAVATPTGPVALA